MKQLNLFLKILLCVLLTACVVLLSVNLFSRAEEKTPILSGEDRNDEETPAYYAKRPCIEMVQEAARIWEDYLAKTGEKAAE